ncbi:hypothetical protein GCM10009584_04520 [Ornithinimicrobium humiphilum]|uniref:Ig-like domain-containing protein n=1 Tax=Ornithinimicrobium humiphilum TaxID=125288 RepID=A0A543K7Z1_9MICO|nr:Ig-like domain-containing protein [Ornithinimicrobium humiphilum]TQM91180.1 hypothetical protein FB476_2911 [Ornithinimicrobium humiphilum]
MPDLRRTAPVLLLVSLVALVLAVPTGFSSAAFTARSTSTATVTSGDWVAPVVRVADLSEGVAGTVPVQVTATDEHGSGVASVVVEYRAQGASTWTRMCVDDSAPWSCSWATASLTDGRYDVRAHATDRAGQPGYSPVVTTVVVNKAPSAPASVVVTSPNSSVKGSTTFAASVSSPVGVTSVTFFAKRGNSNVWIPVCTATAEPWSCVVSVNSILSNGSNVVRAVMVDGNGVSKDSLEPHVEFQVGG